MPTTIRQIDLNNCRRLVKACRQILEATDNGAEAIRRDTEEFKAAVALFQAGGPSEHFDSQ